LEKLAPVLFVCIIRTPGLHSGKEKGKLKLKKNEKVNSKYVKRIYNQENED